MNIVLFGGGLQVLSTARSLKEREYCVDVIGTHNEIFNSSCLYMANALGAYTYKTLDDFLAGAVTSPIAPVGRK